MEHGPLEIRGFCHKRNTAPFPLRAGFLVLLGFEKPIEERTIASALGTNSIIHAGQRPLRRQLPATIRTKHAEQTRRTDALVLQDEENFRHSLHFIFIVMILFSTCLLASWMLSPQCWQHPHTQRKQRSPCGMQHGQKESIYCSIITL
jgi:hypothetical protein